MTTWTPLVSALDAPLALGWEVHPGAARGQVLIAHADLLPRGVLLSDARAALEAFEEPQLAPGADWALVTDPVLYIVFGSGPAAALASTTAGDYSAEWLDLDAQRAADREPLFLDGGDVTLATPGLTGRWALILRRVGR
jgi:hypothetical protein